MTVRAEGYITGELALDVATMCQLEVQSLAYPTGKSPTFAPSVLRYAPEDAYLDLSRLGPWEKFRVVWLTVAVQYWYETLDKMEEVADGRN